MPATAFMSGAILKGEAELLEKSCTFRRVQRRRAAGIAARANQVKNEPLSLARCLRSHAQLEQLTLSSSSCLPSSAPPPLPLADHPHAAALTPMSPALAAPGPHRGPSSAAQPSRMPPPA